MSFWLRVKRRIFRVVFSIAVSLITKLEISDRETIKNTRGTTIVVCNHLGRIDAALSLALAQRDDLILVVAEKYRESVVLSWIVGQLDFLFLERFEADLGTLREVLRRLLRGGLLIIAPEGTRSQTEALLEGKPGAAFLAAKSGATIIPIGVTGSEDRLVNESFSKFRRPHIRIVVGEPFTLPPLPREGRDEFLKQHTDEIMARIAALLPQKYRGVYANHPKLHRLLA